jgi:hypothetical protein
VRLAEGASDDAQDESDSVEGAADQRRVKGITPKCVLVVLAICHNA